MNGMFRSAVSSLLVFSLIVLSNPVSSVALPNDDVHTGGDHNGHVESWRTWRRSQAIRDWMQCSTLDDPWCQPNADALCCNWQTTCEVSRCLLEVCGRYPEYAQCTAAMIDFLRERRETPYCQQSNPCDASE